MKTQVMRRLLTVAQEIADTRRELTMAREELTRRGTTLEDSRLRMLIAETPVADRDLQAAVERFQVVERTVLRLEADLEALRVEQRRLTRAGS
jgi:hypothetical protein